MRQKKNYPKVASIEAARFQKDFPPLMKELGFRDLRPWLYDRWRQGQDPHPYLHYRCEGEIEKIEFGFAFCDHARCLKCGKQGSICPATDYEGDDIYEVTTVRCDPPLQLPDGTLIDDYNEIGRAYAVFEDEPTTPHSG